MSEIRFTESELKQIYRGKEWFFVVAFLNNFGKYRLYYIEKSFFDSASEWTFDGTAEADNEKSSWQEFHLNKGSLVFHKRKFHPDGELFLYSPMKQDD